MQLMYLKSESRWVSGCSGDMNRSECRAVVESLNASGLKIGSRVRLIYLPLGTIGTVTDIVDGKPVVHFESGLELVTIDHAPATDYEVVSEAAYAAELQATAEYVEAGILRNANAGAVWPGMFTE